MKENEETAGKTAHFVDLDPRELTLEDMRIWDEIKKETITREKFNEYKKLLIDEKTGNPKKDIPASRLEFMAFIANKAIPLIDPIFREILLKIKKKNEGNSN